jgi:MHS family metabolite:H+ symporter-like MFS transporter
VIEAPQSPGAPAKVERTTGDLVKAAVSGWLGTAMEFLDFQLYSLAAGLVFSKLFFPEMDPNAAIIASMATYGVGYLARLVGAWFFGRMGDRVGRKHVLFLTIAIMGASTTLIGVLPTYQQIGLWAGVLLMVLRLIQGFGAGAEIAGAGTMLAEYAPNNRRGLIGSLVALGTNSATLIGSGVWALLLWAISEEDLLDWGWRIPFLCSAVVMILAIWIRLSLKESPVFEEREDVVDGKALSSKELKEKAKTDSAISEALKQRKGKAFFIALGLRFGQAGNSGIIQTYLAAFLTGTLLLPGTIPTTAIMISSIVGFATVPLVGWASDHFGRRKMYLIFVIAAIVLAVPCMYFIGTATVETFVFTVVFIVLIHNVAVLSWFSLETITMAELFGARSRFTQLGLAKEVAGVLTTALGPVIAASLMAAFHAWWILAVLIIFYSLITLVAAVAMPEVAGRDLTRLEDAI